jgi:hypothetical protein
MSETPLSPEYNPPTIDSESHKDLPEKGKKSGSDSANRKSSTNLEKPPVRPLRLRNNEALQRLGVSQEQLDAAPKITPILKEVRGGLALALKSMRLSDGEFIRPFLEKYDSVPIGDRDRVSFEAVAIAAHLDIRHLWGEMMLAIREFEVNAVKLIAMSSHASIIKKRVEFAQTIGGYRDRDAIDVMLGALPSVKGTTFIGKAFFGHGGAPEEENVDEHVSGEEVTDDINYIFPDASEIQDKITPMKQKLLEAAEIKPKGNLRTAKKL